MHPRLAELISVAESGNTDALEDALETFLSEPFLFDGSRGSVADWEHPVDLLIPLLEEPEYAALAKRLRRVVGKLITQWVDGRDSSYYLVGLVTLGAVLVPAELRRGLKRLIAGGGCRGRFAAGVDLHEYLLRAVLEIRADSALVEIVKTDLMDPRYTAVAFAGIFRDNPYKGVNALGTVLRVASTAAQDVDVPDMLRLVVDRLPPALFGEFLNKWWRGGSLQERELLCRGLLDIGWALGFSLSPNNSTYTVLFYPSLTGRPVAVGCRLQESMLGDPRWGQLVWEARTRRVECVAQIPRQESLADRVEAWAGGYVAPRQATSS